jgi:hypothetical protein
MGCEVLPLTVRENSDLECLETKFLGESLKIVKVSL